MTLQDYLQLKSGTDVRGTASGEHTNLTNEAIDSIVKSFLYFVCERTGKHNLTVAVGHDSRLSAERITRATCDAATESRCNVLLCGLASTPSMFMILQDQSFGADCSIMITASHMPSEKNGLKFFLPNGGLEGKEVTEILTLAHEGKHLTGAGKIIPTDYMPIYAATLVKKVRNATGKQKPLAGKKIIVDAGNGAGGFYVESVLRPLGADTEGSQFLEPDGSFPNHIPNPEDKTAMQSICAQVKKTNADFGIIFDTDVDRAGAVNSDGVEINRNKLIALISAVLLLERAGGYIVTDSVTSDGLTDFITARGGVHHRFKRGYKNVIDEAKRLNAAGFYAPLAIETSGHAALAENYFLDDGAYLVTRLLISLATMAGQNKEIGDLIADLKTAAEEGEARLGFAAGCDFKTLGAQVLENLQNDVANLTGVRPADNNYEGVRIRFDEDHGDGWALVRMSLHDPILPVNFESNRNGGGKIIAKTLYDLLSKYDFLQLQSLKNFL